MKNINIDLKDCEGKPLMSPHHFTTLKALVWAANSMDVPSYGLQF